MTNEEKLKAIIEKAVKNGLQDTDDIQYSIYPTMLKDLIYSKQKLALHMSRGVLFSHDFAKAYFGEEEMCNEEGEIHTPDKCTCEYPWERPAWIIHLQQAVISSDPISYYYEHI